ncbi:MAG: efflux transporter outer membrane subunit [Akkermansiaceae bacterium]
MLVEDMKFRVSVGFVASLFAIGGCSPVPMTSLERVEPIVAAGIEYQGAGGASYAGSSVWWRSFSDGRLNSDVEAALAGNLLQRQFSARIDQAAALLQKEQAALFPKLNLTGSGGVDLENPDALEGTASLGGLFSWEVDVFGRIRQGVRASEEDYRASIQDWLGGRLVLSAAVAETRFLAIEQRQRIDLLRQQLETNETLKELVQLRVAQGISSRVDLLQQERQMDAVRSLLPEAEAELVAAEYALDVLVGKSPGSRGRDGRRLLPGLPGKPGLGVPSGLLLNRPDLLAQWHRIRAIDARVAQALTERLPRVTLGVSLDGGVIQSAGALLSSLIAEAAMPVLDGGERRAEVKFRRAELEAALSEYSHRYLEAVRDVETAVVRERKQADRIRLTGRQLETARETLKETRVRYSQGLSDYLPVIDALRVVQDLELSMVTLRRQSLSIRVGIHRAIGGPMPRVQAGK